MDLPAPVFRTARAVIGFSQPVRDSARDERFVEATRDAFPNLVFRQFVPADAPPNLAHLQIASTSSSVTLSAIQAEFTVGFYGPMAQDPEAALAYVNAKVHAALHGLLSAGGTPSSIGVVLTLAFSLHEAPATFISDQFLTRGADSALQDAQVRLAFRIGETHFVSLSVSNFEEHGGPVAVMPMMPVVIDAQTLPLVDQGVELMVDVNNKLSLLRPHAPVVDATLLGTTLALARSGALEVGPALIADSSTDVVASLEARYSSSA